MGPFDVFSPSAILDIARWTGPHGAARLVEASQHFPGGPVALVLALFFAPVGPGVPAGVLLARHVPLHPAFTFGLYGLSDLLAAIACHPVFVVFRRHGRKVRPIHWLGRRVQALAMLGVRTAAPGHTAPALSRIATVGFGVDVYTAGMLATGLPVRASVGWASAIAGDLAWFALLLGTSVVAASVADDDRFVAVVMVVAMIAIPRLARRVVPALRSDRRRPAEATRPTAPEDGPGSAAVDLDGLHRTVDAGGVDVRGERAPEPPSVLRQVEALRDVADPEIQRSADGRNHRGDPAARWRP